MYRCFSSPIHKIYYLVKLILIFYQIFPSSPYSSTTTAINLSAESLSPIDQINSKQELISLGRSFTHKIVKRESAFELARLESEMESKEERENSLRAISLGIHSKRDETFQDKKCQEKCNERLRSGLDMVKAHSSFGSIGVPSVVDEDDLDMYCKLDGDHDTCLRDCGFDIQFNMRDYVCVENRLEMIYNLPCYVISSPYLKRSCGTSHCGPYNELSITIPGFAHRCRTLLCDLNCIKRVLTKRCGVSEGTRALQFLIKHTKSQVLSWLKSVAKERQDGSNVEDIIPHSCARIFCPNFNTSECT